MKRSKRKPSEANKFGISLMQQLMIGLRKTCPDRLAGKCKCDESLCALRGARILRGNQ